jgi:putative glutathione S-transferase
LRTLPKSFNSLIPEALAKQDFCPPEHEALIVSMSEWIQRDLNAGVYKVGFAKDQEAYDKKIVLVFGALNKLEEVVHQTGGSYILGKQFTELDIRVYTTLIRFDVIYVQLFKLNLGMIRYDYPILHNWMRNLYWNVPGFKETTNFRHIKEGVRLVLDGAIHD